VRCGCCTVYEDQSQGKVTKDHKFELELNLAVAHYLSTNLTPPSERHKIYKSIFNQKARIISCGRRISQRTRYLQIDPLSSNAKSLNPG
jgi:hypothetical protein